MKNLYHFCLSAFLYWLVATYAGSILIIPQKIFGVAVFLPPVLGLMWGPSAALGVYFGGVLAFPEFQNFFSANTDFENLLPCFLRGFWIFLAGYLPHFLWQKWYTDSEKNMPSHRDYMLRKFLMVMLITFAVTTAFRAVTATAADLDTVANWLGFSKSVKFPAYIFACFVNDFFIAIFLDLAWFFLLVSRGYTWYNSDKKFEETSSAQDEQPVKENKRAWIIALGFYILFPLGVAYIDKYQIYGMDNGGTWLRFVAECLTIIDLYLVLILYLMLRYRRSIMLEVVFLVTQTVFFSAAVLGGGSSIAIGNLVKAHTDESLHAMSVICRERLYRTFFCVRQAVHGMQLQATNFIESYDRLANDAAYRKNYLDEMKNDFSFMAVGIDGSISYYLRLIPEIEGTQGGFSMQREDARWEGALSTFVEREPIDLAPYAPDDIPNVGWYYIPKKSRTATWIEPYVDAVTNFYVISYVAPLFLEGKFIGVVGMDIDFNFIIQELRRMSIYDYGYVYIMNRNNLVLYHRDQPQGAPFEPNPEFQEIEIYLANGMWLGIATPLSRVYDDRNKIIMHLIAAIVIVAMLISIGSIDLASRAIRPLAGMTEAARRIASGDLNVKISYESGNELGILVRSIREMAAKLEVYVYRDKLTGLLNPAAYIGKKAELNEKMKAHSSLKYGVIIFDANFLKKVNDKYGHDAGNELIRRAAKVISQVFANSSVYRVGGDEFATVLENQDYERRLELLELFDKKVTEETFTVAGDTLTVSVARGLGIYEPGMDFESVAKKADAEMYAHKSALKSKLGEEVR